MHCRKSPCRLEITADSRGLASGFSCLGDHPRVCGEYQNVRFSDDWDGGSSPRMRGTRAVRAACGRAGGISPAYAGNTPDVARRACLSGDHPRVCGEHPLWLSRSRFGVGSSPRMRGTLCRCCRTRFRLGIIPAYVGNTVRLTFAWPETWDHPRVCGEHARNAWNGVVGWGSSPRMRGTHAENRRRHNIQRIIPAYAGNTFIVGLVRFMAWDHPRVCGEHATSLLAARFEWGSSPRMRGTQAVIVSDYIHLGIIPAYAGNTSAGGMANA